MPVGQEKVHGITANVNYFHILTEQVHLPVYPAYSRSEVCFLPDGNSRYDLFFLFFFFSNSAYSSGAGNGKSLSIQTDNGEMQNRSAEEIQEMGNNIFRTVVDLSA